MKKNLFLAMMMLLLVASCKKTVLEAPADNTPTENASKKPFNLAFHYEKVNLNGIEYFVDTFAKYTIGPGAEYMQLNFDHSEYPLKVHIISVDGNNQYVDFKPVLARDSVLNTERVTAMAVRKSEPGNIYFAGVNADYFNNDPATPNYGRPWNGTLIDDIIATTPRKFTAGDLLQNEAHAIYNDNRLSIDNIVFSGTMTYKGGNVLNIDRVNMLRGTNTLVYLNKYNGSTTRTNNLGTEVVIKPLNGQSMGVNQDVAYTVTQVRRGLGNTAIPEDGAVLSGNGTVQPILGSFRVGDQVTINLGLQTLQSPFDFTEMVGGMQIILKDSALVPMWFNGAEVHPRTGIGYSEQGMKTYFCVIDGRWPGVSVGVTTEALAQIMRMAGATDALNLDGGGSSTMYARNAGYLGLMNRPQGGTFTRPVGNAIYAVSKAPESETITRISAAQYTYRLKAGETITPKFYGLNEYGLIVNSNLSGVQLSAPAGLGDVGENTFTATGPAKFGKIRANYNGIETAIKVIVE